MAGLSLSAEHRARIWVPSWCGKDWPGRSCDTARITSARKGGRSLPGSVCMLTTVRQPGSGGRSSGRTDVSNYYRKGNSAAAPLRRTLPQRGGAPVCLPKLNYRNTAALLLKMQALQRDRTPHQLLSVQSPLSTLPHHLARARNRAETVGIRSFGSDQQWEGARVRTR